MPGAVKLDPGMVGEIISRYDNGDTPAQLSERYGVACSTISRIVTGKYWSETTGGVNRSRITRRTAYRIAHIEIRIEQGHTSYAHIARELGISRQAVWALIKNYRIGASPC